MFTIRGFFIILQKPPQIKHLTFSLTHSIIMAMISSPEVISDLLKKVADPMEIHKRQSATVLRFEGDRELPNGLKTQLAHLRSDVPNVAILYYGGTLGMEQDKDGHLVPTDNIEKLLQPLIIKGLKERINPVWFQVTSHAIDSTNGRWPHWATIGYAIKALHLLFEDIPGGINGFVVAGGTDTMAHLSTALRFILPNIGRPVITTGAQQPIFVPGTDAESNLYFALSAATEDLSGIHQAFDNVLRDGRFIHKVRDKGFNAFDTVRGAEFGENTSDGIILNASAPRRNRFVKSRDLEFNPDFQDGVKISKLSPATPSESLLHDALDPTTQATLLITYGAGNVRNEGLLPEELNHIDVLRILREHQYPVVLGSPMLDGAVESPYATGAKAVEKGVEAISGRNTTGASLEVKMMRCLRLSYTGYDIEHPEHSEFDYKEFVEQMRKNHIGEIRETRRI